jgi:hypothetical protein
MLRFSTQGDPFERGRQQGQATAGLALPWAEKIFRDLARRFGLASSQKPAARLGLRLDPWRQQMERLYPEGVQECCGLAAGLGLEESAYFCLVFYHRLAGLLPQCTVVACRDQEGRPLLGKTDDIYGEELGLNVLEITRPSEGYGHVQFHFAGTIWTVAGMNERGLALGMTGIPGPLSEEEGLFSLVALHTILPACASVEEAIVHLRDLRLNAYGFSLVLGDAEGALALVEKTEAGSRVFAETEVPLVHTNHILDPEFARQNPQQSEPVNANGRRRYANALALLGAGADPQTILCNRAPQGAICQRGEDGLHTDFAVVFAPQEKKMCFWAGYPGQVEMERVEVGALFGT